MIVFLDRDGTLNREVGFVTGPAQLELLPGVKGAVEALVGRGFVPVVVTNQSGIARGLYRQSDLAAVHETLHQRLGCLPRGYFHCPHHPNQAGPYGRACTCRKPGAGLLWQAAEMLGMPLDGSYLIGDSSRDVLMARGLPVRTILHKAGKPFASEWAELQRVGFTPDHVAEDLVGAVAWILNR